MQNLVLETRSGRAETTVTTRTDLPKFFGEEPAMEFAGFEVYLPGPPDIELEFSGLSGNTGVRSVVSVPRHPLPVVPSAIIGPLWGEAMASAVAASPEGRVLALGMRTASEQNDAMVRAHFPGREVVGVDIHPGLGVQVVADAHELDRTFGEESAAIVYSGSLLEHVAAPWLVARACNAVLVAGGYVLHHVPWSWPTHAEPNDFWRMSPEGLGLLFGPPMGFEVIATGSEVNVRMHVQPDAELPYDPREVLAGFSTTHSAAASWIVARKIGAPAGAIAWPYEGTMAAEVATRYPIDGLAAPPV